MMNTYRALLCFGVSACGPQVPVPEQDTTVQDDDDDDDDDVGERPGAGAMYGPCRTSEDCTPLEFCVFPPDESGFCSAACGRGDDASPCAAAPGAGAVVSCLDIGTPDGRTVCALDCADGACPAGMGCEAIATPSGGRRDICF